MSEFEYRDTGDEYISPFREVEPSIDKSSPLQQELTAIVDNHIDDEIRHKMGCGCPQCKIEAMNIVEFKAHPFTITRQHAGEVAIFMHNNPNEHVVFKAIPKKEENNLEHEPHLHE